MSKRPDWAEFMYENEGKLHVIAREISYRPEEHRDELIANIHEWLFRRAYLLQHRPRHTLKSLDMYIEKGKEI